MKTLYEKQSRLGLNSILFGYPKKSNRFFYLLLLGLIVLIGLVG